MWYVRYLERWSDVCFENDYYELEWWVEAYWGGKPHATDDMEASCWHIIDGNERSPQDGA